MDRKSELLNSAIFRMKLKFDKAFFKDPRSEHEFMFLNALNCCIEHSPEFDGRCVKASSISKYTGLPKSAVSKMLNILEKKNFITRSHSSDDRRVVYISISEDGKLYLINTKKSFDNLLALIADELGEENTAEFIRFMEVAISVIEKNNDKKQM
ncbi:MAG: MarR family winged helix-turn-helix transcriptional regulator [Oscillospiraceae bacterium]